MTEPIGRTDLERLRDVAQSQTASLEADLRALIEASRSSNADDEHDPEGATIAFERAQLIAVRDAAQRRLADLNAALQRFDTGDYGRCDVCGQAIPADRLAARPAARTCVACAPRR